MKKAQLFLLHFAGGNSYSFQFMAAYLKDFEVISLELPGRGRRMGEDLLRDFDLAALDLYDQVVRQLNSPDFLIYGHSMGAYLGLRVSSMLEEAGRPPAYLFVSGNAGPGIREGKNRHMLEREEFIGELKRLGGIPKEFFEDNELFELFEPILRADFEIAERNDIKDEPAIAAPLFAMMGDQEENVEEIANWGRYTQSQYRYEILEGDHFFIHKHAGRVAHIIKYNYDAVTRLSYQLNKPKQ